MIKNVYFFCCPPGPPENTSYLHTIVSIVEGLQEIGVTAYSNIDYWQTESGYLLKKANVDYRNCDVVFIDAALYEYGLTELLPADIFDTTRKYKLVYSDMSDGLITTGFNEQFRSVDIVLRAHYSSNYTYPSNFVPWQFGITNRIINQVAPLPFKQRKKQFLNNFRVSHPLRDIAQKRIAPIFRKVLSENTSVDTFEHVEGANEIDKIYWEQTGRRHYPNFYKRLSESYACFCFGGSPQKFISEKKGFFWDLVYRIDWHFPFIGYNKIFQWDSWRIWESLVAGCCMVHVDFDRYGFVLPVMPVNGEHYLGFDLDNVSKMRKLIRENPDIFEKIGNSGREWVLENYSPKKVAERFTKLFE